MKIMKSVIAVVFALVAFNAFAQTNWTGFYAGLNTGYVSGAVEETPDQKRDEAKPKGALFGAQLGYSKQFDGNVVLGLEADMRMGNVSGSRSAETCQGCVGYSNVETTKTELNWSGSTRVRLGYAINRFLPYVTGGVAFASVKTTTNNVYLDTTNKNAGADSFSVTRGAVGYVLGAGLEYAVTRNLAVGAEYRRESFNLEKNGGNFSAGSKDLVNNIGRIAVNYRF
jgi:outer membrane immunogenic protein